MAIVIVDDSFWCVHDPNQGTSMPWAVHPSRKGRRIVVVKFTNRFLREIADSGVGRSLFRYSITTACRPKCRTPTSRANVFLRVVSPN
jgi:hypothetical protein